LGRIVVSENVKLDGVVEDPAGVEGFGRGGWVGRIGESGREEAPKVVLEEALGPEAQLLGRRAYEFLAARWRLWGAKTTLMRADHADFPG
jgi:hypothetical protein